MSRKKTIAIVLFIAQFIYPAIFIAVRSSSGMLSASYYDNTPVLDNGQVADFDHNGILDCVGEDWNSHSAKIYLNGIFTSVNRFDLDPLWDPLYEEVNTVHAGDFNGDGLDDVLFDAKRWNVEKTHLFLGNGSGNWFQKIEINDTLARGGEIMMVGKLNADNCDDVVVKCDGFLSVGLKILPDSNPYFLWYNLAIDADDVAIGDENEDSLPDLFILKQDKYGSERVFVIRGRSDYNFSLSNLESTNIQVSPEIKQHLVVGDFEKDGNLGVALLTGTSVRIFSRDPSAFMTYNQFSLFDMGETYDPIGITVLPATRPGNPATLFVTVLTPREAIYVHGVHITGAFAEGSSLLTLQMTLLSVLFYFGGIMFINLVAITFLDKYIYNIFNFTLTARRGRLAWLYTAPGIGIGIFVIGRLFLYPTSTVLAFLQVASGALFWIIFVSVTVLWAYTSLRPYLKFYKSSKEVSSAPKGKFEKKYEKEQKKDMKEQEKYAKKFAKVIPIAARDDAPKTPLPSTSSNDDLSKPFHLQLTPPRNKQCPQCSIELPEEARFCNKCGHQF